MKLKKVLCVAAIVAAALAAGIDAHAAELPKDANTTCPVMVDKKVDPDLFVDYKGERIFLCCNKCKRAFNKNPDKFLARVKAADKDSTASVKAKQVSQN